MSRRLSHFLALLLLFGTSSSAAQPLAALLDNGLPLTPETARVFDYCSATEMSAGFDRESMIPVMSDRSGATPAADRATAMLVDAGVAVARANDKQKRCDAAFKKGVRLYEKRLAKRLRERNGKNLPEAQPADSIDGIRQNLRRLWVLDQAARMAYLDLRTDDSRGGEFWAYRLSVANALMIDAESGVFIKQALESYDWIDIKRFGEAASNQAWLLAQHADTDVAFQADALDRMAAYLDSGGVSKRNYAYLWDRVAVNQGRLQRYGTQPESGCVDGQLTLKPSEDPDNLDARRQAMGMGPVADHLAQMSARRC
ncbi:MAG: DUF6624 domain-containing protein [Pseudomonadota bacterium]